MIDEIVLSNRHTHKEQTFQGWSSFSAIQERALVRFRQRKPPQRIQAPLMSASLFAVRPHKKEQFIVCDASFFGSSPRRVFGWERLPLCASLCVSFACVARNHRLTQTPLSLQGKFGYLCFCFPEILVVTNSS